MVDDPAPPVERSLRFADSHKPRLTTGGPRSDALLLSPSRMRRRGLSLARTDVTELTSALATKRGPVPGVCLLVGG
jgi:hypothetical protein